MRRFSSFILISLFLLSPIFLKAQMYSSDAALVSISGNVAVITGSGTTTKKKDAQELAAKSIIYTYLTSGIDGLNNGRPLLGTKPSQAAQQYLIQLLSGGRYASFMKSCVLDEKASKNVAKSFMAFVTVELYYESLYKDLVNNGVIGKDPSKVSLEESQEELALPTIVVVPYCHDGQTYKEAIQANSDIRMAMAKVDEGFINKGVSTKNFEQCLKNAEQFEAVQGAKTGGLSLDDALVNNSGADVSVNVDISKDVNAQGLRVSMTLNAVEVSTGKTLATRSEVSGRKNATADMMCAALADYMIDSFLKQISTSMAKKLSAGNTIAINFTIDPNSPWNMDSEIGGDYLPLSDAIIIWIQDNAKNGRYHQKGRSETLLQLDEIQILNKDANGNDMNINNFSLELYKFFRKNEIQVKRDIVGNSINVTIL